MKRNNSLNYSNHHNQNNTPQAPQTIPSLMSVDTTSLTSLTNLQYPFIYKPPNPYPNHPPTHTTTQWRPPLPPGPPPDSQLNHQPPPPDAEPSKKKQKSSQSFDNTEFSIPQQQHPQQHQQQQQQQKQQQNKKNNHGKNQKGNNNNNNNNNNNTAPHPIEPEMCNVVNKKSKRKSMSVHYASKEWCLEDAKKALSAEGEMQKTQKVPELIIKFPDPDLNSFIVKQFSDKIAQVHFQQPCTPRYCSVKLKPETDIEAVISEINKIQFGTGLVHAEVKCSKEDDKSDIDPDEVDPYTLYIGNLPRSTPIQHVKDQYPGAIRYDMGYAKKMKFTRYAFIRYTNVDQAIEGFRRTVNIIQFDNRSVIVRFRRLRGLCSESSKLLEKTNKASELQTDDKTETPNFEEDTYEGSITNSRRCTIDSVASMNDSDLNVSIDGAASMSTSRRSTVDSLQSLNDSIPSTIDSRRSTVDSVAFTGSHIDLSLVKAEPHSDDECTAPSSDISSVADMTTIKTEPVDIKTEPRDADVMEFAPEQESDDDDENFNHGPDDEDEQDVPIYHSPSRYDEPVDPNLKVPEIPLDTEIKKEDDDFEEQQLFEDMNPDDDY
ncbi:unnamed protein product [Diamesa tonsa]